MRLIYILSFLLISCSSATEGKETNPTQSSEEKGSDTTSVLNPDTTKEVKPILKADLFKEITPDFRTQEPILPEGYTFDILFKEKELIKRFDGKMVPAKGNHDMCQYIPINGSSEHGYLYVSHETKRTDTNLGDGGGGSMFEVKFENGKWNTIGDITAIDFSHLGGTLRNCGGTLTPDGKILSCEEYFPTKNSHIYYNGKGILDTSDYNGKPRYMNYGWMVEIDPETKLATRKLHQMGRFMHEDAEVTPDGKTVYLTDDYNPAVFFKFECNKPYSYNDGQLFAYKQSADGEGGEWLELPMDTASLENIRDVALGMGASMFVRHEWIAEYNGKYYITETGDDDFNWTQSKEKGGVPAKHVTETMLKFGDDYDDTYGRVLEFDPVTLKMSVYLEGGFMSDNDTDSTRCFSNPDCNTMVTYGDKTFMVINEDINWYTRGRASSSGPSQKNFYNEIYFLDMSIENPTVDDLMRFAMGPRGCETSGGTFTPDGKTYFVNLMHPFPRNTTIYNKSMTIAVRGFLSQE